MAEAVFRRPWDDRQARPRRYSPYVPARRAWPSARIAQRVSALENYRRATDYQLTRRRHLSFVQPNTTYSPGASLIVLTGATPVVTSNAIASPSAGQVLFTGASPALTNNVALSPLAGQIVLSGATPILVVPVNTTFSPLPGLLSLTGAPPTLSADWFAIPPDAETWTAQASATSWSNVTPDTETWTAASSTTAWTSTTPDAEAWTPVDPAVDDPC